MDRGLSRRAFLGAVGAAAVGGTAGCTSGIPIIGDGPSIDEDGLPVSEDATTQFRGGLTRRGVYPDAAIPETAEIEWTVPAVNTGDHTAAKASAVELPSGDLVVPGDTGEIRRVTPGGDVEWTAAVNETTRGIHGTPAVANETVYIGAYDGAMYAFDVETGDRFWRKDIGGSIGSSPAYDDGTVYIAVEYPDPSGALYALDAVTGEVAWDDQRITDHPHSTCAIDHGAERIVVGSNDGFLYAWSYPDLEFQWSFETGDAIKGPIATADGSAFFGSWDHSVYRVALDDGSEEWAFETGDKVMTGPSVETDTGTVYAGGHDRQLYALEMDSGDEQWAFETGWSLIGCPTVTRDHVLVGSNDGNLYAVEKTSGDETWRVPVAGTVSSTPLVADGAVYFTDRASSDYLDAEGGEPGGFHKVVAAE